MDDAGTVMLRLEDVPVIMPDDAVPQPWWGAALRVFKASLSRPDYPCHFGRIALAREELFTTFFEDSVAPLVSSLTEFLDMSRQHLDQKMVLAAFHKSDGGPASERSYAERFWQVLQQLHDHDDRQWPPDYPSDPENSKWEYSFHGVPMFVFAAAPSYGRRMSRNLGPGLILLFQPRNVFHGIEGGTRRGVAARLVIRKRLSCWDTVDPHPDLGDYGDPSNFEWRQYFIPDNQSRLHDRCPLRLHSDNGAVSAQTPDKERASQR